MALTLFALTLLAFNRLLLLPYAFCFDSANVVSYELDLLYAFDLLYSANVVSYELSLLLLCERSELTLTFVLMFLTFTRTK